MQKILMRQSALKMLVFAGVCGITWFAVDATKGRLVNADVTSDGGGPSQGAQDGDYHNDPGYMATSDSAVDATPDSTTTSNGGDVPTTDPTEPQPTSPVMTSDALRRQIARRSRAGAILPSTVIATPNLQAVSRQGEAMITGQSSIYDNRPGIGFVWQLTIRREDGTTFSDKIYSDQIFTVGENNTREPTFSDVVAIPPGNAGARLTLHEVPLNLHPAAIERIVRADTNPMGHSSTPILPAE